MPPDPTEPSQSRWLGKGRGSKTLVRQFVNKLLNAEIKNDHEADACAAAIAVLLAQKEKGC